MTKRPRLFTTLLASAGLSAGLGIGLPPAGAAPNPGEQAASIRADEAMAAVGEKSPIGMLYRAHRYEQARQPAEALWIYQQLLDDQGLDPRWRREAALAVARWHLSQPATADPAAAATHLAMLPDEPDSPSFVRQTRLWAMMVQLHRAADEAVAGAPASPAVDVDAAIGVWRVPSKIRPDVARAFERLAQRFDDEPARAHGLVFFKSLATSTSHPLIQKLAFRHLTDMALAEGDAELAFAAARAYWLTTVDDPNRLPAAIDRVAAALAERGADAEAVKAFRYLQMLGKEAEAAQAVTLLQSGTPEVLFDAEAIDRADEGIERARMLLFNGDMDAAVPLLKAELGQQDGVVTRSDALTLARMVFAFHDGHMHRVDRYEAFLRSGGGDPLAALSGTSREASREPERQQAGG